MARRSRPCDLLRTLTALLLVAGAAVVVVVADDGDEKCGNPCGNPCGVPCIYASPPPPAEYYPPPAPVYSPPPPEYYPPPAPEYYPPPAPEYYPPTKPGCSPPPSGGGGYEPTPETPSGGYNPAPYTPGGGGGGWYSPPYLPSYNTPPGTLYPQDPGFKPNGAPGGGATWREVAAVAAAAVAGALAL